MFEGQAQMVKSEKDEIIKRYTVRKQDEKWFVFSTGKWYSGWSGWHFVNYYDTHAEALQNAFKYADIYTATVKHFLASNP